MAATGTVLPLSARSPQALARWRSDTWILAGCPSGRWTSQTSALPPVPGGRISSTGLRSWWTQSEHARELLAGLAENRLGPGAVRGVCGDPPKTAWLFTGQGSQYPGMTRELFDDRAGVHRDRTRCAEAVEGIFRVHCWTYFSTPMATSENALVAHLICAARAVRRRDGPGPAVAIMGDRARRGARPQRRPVRGGLCGRGVRSRGWSAVGRRTRPAVRHCCPMAAEWWRCSPIPSTSRTSPTSSRGCRWPPTTAPNTVLSGPADDLERVGRARATRRGSATPGWTPATPSTPS